MTDLNAIRIFSVDYYMTAPIQNLDVIYSDFRGSSVAQVPIIRIFGSTDNGKKICLHIHGVFPYFYLPYDGVEEVDTLKYQIASNIDKAINISFGQGSSTCQHVYKIGLVSGIPFYGYHSRSHQFFKVFLYNPALIRKVSNLLYSEAILGKLYQPHETHIPFILQFMIDYNLHGMSNIVTSELKYRRDSSDTSKENDQYLPAYISKMSFCELEADALAKNIINRLEISTAVNPGIAALWEDEKQRRRDKNEDSYIEQCLTLSNTSLDPTKSHLIFKQALTERLLIYQQQVNKKDHNISVYPAETPEENTSLDASFLDVHTSLSSDRLNDSLNCSTVIDEDANNLMQILNDLGDDQGEPEEDSILSQIEKEEDEDYFDLSMPLDPSTPDKISFERDRSSDSDEDSLNQTLVPQLDGNFDDSSSSEDDDNLCVNRVSLRKEVTLSKYSTLPMTLSSVKAMKNQSGTNAKVNFEDNFEKVKRRLSFESDLLDVTVQEEKIECYLRQQSSNKNINFETSPNKKQILQDYFLNGSDKDGLTKADIYDLETNFIAKEGSSNMLTQSSGQSCDNVEDEKFLSRTDCFQKRSDQDAIASSISKTNLSTESMTCPIACNQNDNFDNMKTCKRKLLLIPKRSTPSRENIFKTMKKFNIPIVEYESPFYDSVEDFAGSIEVGHSVLKIPSKTTAHLDDFKSSYKGLESVRKIVMPENLKYNFENIKKLKLSYCEDKNHCVKPLKDPPTRREVQKWLSHKAPIQTNIITNKIPKTKIYIPATPGRADESDMDISLTISPPCENNWQSSLSEKEKNSSENQDLIIIDTAKRMTSHNNKDQLSGITLNNTYGFVTTPDNYINAKAVKELQNLTILSMELHIRTRGDFKPDPACDNIRAIFYSIMEDKSEKNIKTSILAVNSIDHITDDPVCIFNGISSQTNIIIVDSETDMIYEYVKECKKCDPDILIGFEIELLSWGYLIERAHVLGINLVSLLSRTKERNSKNQEDDKGLKFSGRITLDGWRLFKHEIALQSYTFENLTYHLMHKRIPSFSFRELTFWWEHRSSVYRHRTISYYVYRVEGILKLVEQLDLMGRTSELARLFGIQFYEVLSRGSQFRVESMMLRLAKPLNYIPVSPSIQQRAKMKAPEFLPLILEPESKLYVDPVIVLDFQSLYPSMIIAYNYCFSTCIGKVNRLGTNSPFEFAATELKISKARVQKLLKQNHLNFSPCGVAFVKSVVRDGILPRMLREILGTRLMVKKSMKENKDNKLLQKVLHNRQLGLKLIANVTYGYTAANFSGRMPAVELGDSVVSKGRETLQRAIAMVENTPEWNVKVVYGDTDSLFVLVPGRSKSEAFSIGQKIAEAITKDNPDPVKLKLEKVYLPCILQTKKRYVGYMYESPDQTDPVYDAKGIETVRRDGCPAVSKMLEKCLRLLFETKNVSLIKKYVLRQFYKILTGRVSLQDLTFAKEYRGASGYRPGACVPALELTRQWTLIDKRNEPRSGQRVPYIIANGPPGLPLIKLVRCPRDFLEEPTLTPNTIYYITKVIIPPINRCLNLIGADLSVWFNQMPRKQFHYIPTSSPGKKFTIAQYFSSTNCICCGQQAQNTLCVDCRDSPQNTAIILSEKMQFWEQAFHSTNMICQSCTGILEDNYCNSLDCPMLYKNNQTRLDVQKNTLIRDLLSSLEYQF